VQQLAPVLQGLRAGRALAYTAATWNHHADSAPGATSCPQSRRLTSSKPLGCKRTPGTYVSQAASLIAGAAQPSSSASSSGQPEPTPRPVVDIKVGPELPSLYYLSTSPPLYLSTLSTSLPSLPLPLSTSLLPLSLYYSHSLCYLSLPAFLWGLACSLRCCVQLPRPRHHFLTSLLRFLDSSLDSS